MQAMTSGGNTDNMNHRGKTQRAMSRAGKCVGCAPHKGCNSVGGQRPDRALRRQT